MKKDPEKLYRYSAREWLEKSLYAGKFKLNSASEIKRIENDHARQDDEQRIEKVIAKDNSLVTIVKTGKKINLASDVKVVSEITTDFYMLCLTRKKESYLFKEFKGADSCLIIHDVEEFRNRIYRKTQTSLPNFHVLDAPAVYGSYSDLGPIVEKPLRYIFQAEWRFAWIPKEGNQQNLDSLLFEIGNIEDIAEIIPQF